MAFNLRNHNCVTIKWIVANCATMHVVPLSSLCTHRLLKVKLESFKSYTIGNWECSSGYKLQVLAPNSLCIIAILHYGQSHQSIISYTVAECTCCHLQQCASYNTNCTTAQINSPSSAYAKWYVPSKGTRYVITAIL